MQYKDYYAILGIPRDSTDQQVKQAYRRLARKYHPDVNRNDPGATERFREVNEAYQALSDPERRRRYDQVGPDWSGVAGGPGRPGPTRVGNLGDVGDLGDFSDFFRSLFGDLGAFAPGDAAGPGRGRVRRIHVGPGFATLRPTPPAETTRDLPIELTEAAHGGTRTVTTTAPCGHCGGVGRGPEGACPACHGDGQVARTVEVTIPPGVVTGDRLRLPAGDGLGRLLLRVVVTPHPVFRLEGRDLVCDVDIPVPVAALGGRVEVPTLDGSVDMRVPAGTNAGRVFRLRGQGLPGRGDHRGGDLLARARLVIPYPLSADEQQQLRQWAEERRLAVEG